MLSLFEAMQCTTTDIYREHIQGAAKTIELVGPDACATNLFSQNLFPCPDANGTVLQII